MDLLLNKEKNICMHVVNVYHKYVTIWMVYNLYCRKE